MYCSHSQINKYETCPRQYKFYYVNRFRAVEKSANLSFGSAIHQILAEILNDKAENDLKPAGNYREAFKDIWREEAEEGLSYGKYDSFDKLESSGAELIELFFEEELERFHRVHAVEERVKFTVGKVDFIGFIDCIAEVVTPQGELVTAIIDFKTSSRAYGPEKVKLADQLTCYYRAGRNIYFGEGEIDKVGYVILQKKKSPEIQWALAERDESDIEEYENKVKFYTEAIGKKFFNRKPGMHCSWCDFQSICMDDLEKAEKEVVFEIYEGPALRLGEVNELPVKFEGSEERWDYGPETTPMEAVRKFVKANSIEGDYIFKVVKDFKGRPKNYYYQMTWGNNLVKLGDYEDAPAEEFEIPF